MKIIVNSINQTYGENEQTNQVIVALSGNSTSGNGDYLSSSVNVTAKDLPEGKTFDDVLDSEIETLARKKLAAYAAGAMPVRVSSIIRNYDQQTHEISNVVVSLLGSASDGSNDYINCRTTITKEDLPSDKTFATMTAADLKALAKAKLVEVTKVA
ncbi:hypothetical protein LUB13_00485 [Lactobacillus delbrueckii subsp. lactis]|uniref:hypothetical protein n=1 Tax=Lactobacillus delbrueckii TaxID=1584 RepID=UPI001E532415|nr:hypothetical protein [Lactobacillus delbrueckii]MCD9217906.1 hypothetical protein [Lactobacillus delbrueckii subsp. lactis]